MDWTFLSFGIAYGSAVVVMWKLRRKQPPVHCNSEEK